MKSLFSAVVAIAILAMGGIAHGLWSHRWVPWDGALAQASASRIDRVPLNVGEWVGQKIETDPLSLPEEVTGRGISIRFIDQRDGTVVYAYIACGPTGAAIAHVPTVCFPANGYASCSPDLRVQMTSDPACGQFRQSEFKRGEENSVKFVRVFWAWSDGKGWRTPDNPGREFRHTPVVYKCYLTRVLATTEEPSDTDPCGRLWTLLQPELDRALFAD